jgi:hypothetical protein
LGDAYVTGTSNTGFGVSGVVVMNIDPFGGLIYGAGFAPPGPGPAANVGYGIAVDGAGFAYVTGKTTSPAFPITPGVFMPAFGGPTSDGFVFELAPGGGLVYSTYLVGPGFGPFPHAGYGIAAGTFGDCYVTGSSNIGGGVPGPSMVLVGHLAPLGVGLIYGSALPPGPVGSIDVGRGIALDPLGNAYITGSTSSPAFLLIAPDIPFFAPPVDGFLTKLDPFGAPFYSSYLGAPGGTVGNAVAVDIDPTGLINDYVTGTTSSPVFPTTPFTVMPFFTGDPSDGFVTDIV